MQLIVQAFYKKLFSSEQLKYFFVSLSAARLRNMQVRPHILSAVLPYLPYGAGLWATVQRCQVSRAQGSTQWVGGRAVSRPSWGVGGLYEPSLPHSQSSSCRTLSESQSLGGVFTAAGALVLLATATATATATA